MRECAAPPESPHPVRALSSMRGGAGRYAWALLLTSFSGRRWVASSLVSFLACASIVSALRIYSSAGLASLVARCTL